MNIRHLHILYPDLVFETSVYNRDVHTLPIEMYTECNIKSM